MKVKFLLSTLLFAACNLLESTPEDKVIIEVCYHGFTQVQDQASIIVRRLNHVDDGPAGLDQEWFQELKFLPSKLSFPSDAFAVNSYQHTSISLSSGSTSLTSVQTEENGCEIQAAFLIEASSSYSKDNLFVYHYGNKVPEADPNSFTIVDGFGRDNSYIYCGRKAISNKLDDFRTITNNYTTDDEFVFIGCNIIQDASPSSFTVVSYAYSKDETNVFYYGQNVNMDSPSFSIIGPPELEYAKDENLVVYQGKTLSGADPTEIEILEYSRYAKDNQNVYFQNLAIEADASTFQIIYAGAIAPDIYGVCVFAKDASKVFAWGKVISGLDPVSTVYKGYTARAQGFDGSESYDCYLEDHSGYWQINFLETIKIDNLPPDIVLSQ